VLLPSTEEHKALRETAEAFGRDKVLPIIAEYDREERFPRELVRELAKVGWLGGALPAEYGGSDMDYTSLAVVVEELGRFSQPVAAMAGTLSTAVGVGVLKAGDEEQRRRFLAPAARGDTVGGLAVTEPRSGSDVAGMTTRARRVDGGWIVDGVKAWIDGAGNADWFVTFAQSDPGRGKDGVLALVVERGMPGFTTTEYRNKLGWRPASVGELSFQEVFVPDANVLRGLGGGYRVAMSAVSFGRLLVAARLTGGIHGALDASVAYAKDRVVFGQPIGKFQLIQTKIVDMSIALDNARFLTYRLAAMLDRGEQARKEASMAKLYAAEAFMRAATDAVQIHGAYGVSEDFPVARMFRDAKVSEIVEGSNEIHRVLIAEYELGFRT
jgi:alkylation response protein AidB-like acyl-CoA dehydrogenase